MGFGNYKEIFTGVESTLKKQYPSKDAFNAKYERFKHFENRTLSDNDYFSILVKIAFYSGFRAATVEKRMPAIERNFPDIETVANYDTLSVSRIMADTEMIRHEKKIQACVANAKTMKMLIKKHGSMQNYIDSFKASESDENLFNLYNNLQRRFNPLSGFYYLSEVTAYHFLTDIGMQVMKPDRVILRIFYKLGLIKDRKQTFEAAVVQGRKFSKATGYPIRYIDIIFVKYGQAGKDIYFGLSDGICLENTPKCHICGVKKFCSGVNN